MSTCLVHITLFACIFISARNLFQYDKRKLLVNTKCYVRGKKWTDTFNAFICKTNKMFW